MESELFLRCEECDFGAKIELDVFFCMSWELRGSTRLLNVIDHIATHSLSLTKETHIKS